MEEINSFKAMKIAITGPESTGKTQLSRQLATYFEGLCIPEYARSYVESLSRPYTYLDVLHIAGKQIKEIEDSHTRNDNYVFLDTELIITRVWLEVVYSFSPEWLNTALSNSKIDLYLLCNLDIPWIEDNIRENGGEMREKLFHIYKQLIETNGFRYRIVTGTGNLRFKNALSAIEEFIRSGHV
jgi:NadR type nicotinamide-nucleotide adenylyltransferase